MKLYQRVFLLLIGALLLGASQQPQFCHAQSSGLVISQVGLSQAQGTTFLTMILNQAAQPKVQPVTDRQAPQLLIDFPGAKVSSVPTVQSGDQRLVKQVRVGGLPGGSGVRVTVDLMPGIPYSYWRSSRTGPRGGYQYLVGIKPDKEIAAPAPATPPARTYGSERESRPPAEAESSTSTERRDYGASSEYQRPTSGDLGEIARQVPAAGPLLGYLQQQGFTTQKDSSGRGGGKKFLLTSTRYPNLSVKIESIPTKVPGAPAIDLVSLSTDKIADSDADKYRQMIRWDMAKIKSHYEDIGDYYDDGLKPLRIRLRERSKAAVLRDAEFYNKFMEVAVPQKPDLPEKIRKHIQDKPNKRLEGALYTESENPLVILDMTDFYTIRVYYIGR